MRTVVSYGTAKGLQRLHDELVKEAVERARVAENNAWNCPRMCNACWQAHKDASAELDRLTRA